LAFTKKEKGEILVQYNEWVSKSQAFFVLEYSKMKMKDVDTLRAKVRDAGGELHVCKNTLLSLAMKNDGITTNKFMEGSSIVGFSFSEPPALAKVFADATKSSEIFKIKGAYLDKKPISVSEVKALAELPPLPVLRAKLLGTLLAPASQLVRTLAEPARQIASVLKAHSEKSEATA
jgi:large subunit ribosomal protein L10